jgi:hypothetical protein
LLGLWVDLEKKLVGRSVLVGTNIEQSKEAMEKNMSQLGSKVDSDSKYQE